MRYVHHFLLLFLAFSSSLQGYVKPLPEEEEYYQEEREEERDDDVAERSRESKERDYYNLYYKNKRRVENKRERYRYYQAPSQNTYDHNGEDYYLPYNASPDGYYPYP